MTLEYDPPTPSGPATHTTTAGIEVRELTTPVAERLTRYRIPTIRRNTTAEPDFRDFTPDGAKASTEETDAPESLARVARNWGSGIWPLPRWKSKVGRSAGKGKVLTLRVGSVSPDDSSDTERRYLRKREYSVSVLPVFRVDPAERGTEAQATEDHQRGIPAGVDPLSPAQPLKRDYDTIRLALYAEAMNAWRQLTDVRFRLMGLLAAISIVAFVPLLLVIQGRNPFLAVSGLVLSLLGLGLTHGLHIYQARNDELYGDLISRARRIEAELGVDTGVILGRPAPATPWVNHWRATQWVYRCVKLAWLAVAVVLATAAVVFAVDWISGDANNLDGSEVDIKGRVTVETDR